ncbi:MAG: hypothetical protein NDI60_08365, partial [Elusimicrobiales bacterium]|nr:hypothetical protein [Elusimicrobiales bacterium]
MAEKITLVINSAFGLTLAALAAAAARYVFRREVLGRPDLWFAAAGAALTAALGMLWGALGRPPLSNQYESLLTLLWFIFPLTFYFHRR